MPLLPSPAETIQRAPFAPWVGSEGDAGHGTQLGPQAQGVDQGEAGGSVGDAIDRSAGDRVALNGVVLTIFVIKQHPERVVAISDDALEAGIFLRRLDREADIGLELRVIGCAAATVVPLHSTVAIGGPDGIGVAEIVVPKTLRLLG
ncbi:MAG: hypothetical protein ACK46L_05460 [Synechococcaceae cyanobacterium]